MSFVARTSLLSAMGLSRRWCRLACDQMVLRTETRRSSLTNREASLINTVTEAQKLQLEREAGVVRETQKRVQTEYNEIMRGEELLNRKATKALKGIPGA